MRILIAHNHYQVPGGEDAVASSEAALLKSFGEDVAVYERSNDELSRLGPVGRFQHMSSLRFNRRSYEELREVIRRHRPQVAHFHNIFYMMTPAVYRACHDEGVAVVQSLHNFRMMCSNGLFFRDGHACEDCLKKNLLEGVKHRCFRQSTVMTAVVASTLSSLWRQGTWFNDVDLYIAAAEFTRAKHIERGIPAGKIVIKPHFVYPEPKDGHADGGYVLYVGRLSEEKGVRTLLEAWRLLGGLNIPLKIAGSGPLSDELKKFVQDHKMSNVEFLGFIDPAQCERLLRGANAAVIPSLCYENFPRVVVEAFACGTPVIASSLGSLAELVEEGRTGLLIEPGSAAHLSRAVRWCFEHPAETRRMGQEARRMFEQKYSAQPNYQKLISIYQQAIQKRQGVPRE
jgi:glycosyltransferase involved in cell wall biosynthesis